MKAIKIDDKYIIPQIGYEILYSSSYGVSGRLDEPIRYYLCNRVEIRRPNTMSTEMFEFNSKEKAFLFISDLIEGFDIKEIIDPYNEKYHGEDITC